MYVRSVHKIFEWEITIIIYSEMLPTSREITSVNNHATFCILLFHISMFILNWAKNDTLDGILL